MKYLDTKSGFKFTDPEAARMFLQIVGSPNFDRQRLPYFKQFDPTNQLSGTAQKSFPDNPILGINGGLAFAVCEWMEMGYGIFDGYTDGERLLSWLGPTFFYDQEKIIFRVNDWRERMASSRGSANTWDCQPITATDVPLKGCVFDYCFDWDRYFFASVPAGVKPSDVAEPCMVQYPINVFGQQFTDPIALRDWELATKSRILMLERLIDGNWAASTPGDNYQEDGVLHFFDNWVERHPEVSGYCRTEFAPVTIPVTGADYAAKMAMFVKSVTDELQTIEFRARRLDGQAQIPFDNIVLLMNEIDAYCINYLQACETKCQPSFFNVNQPSDIMAFWTYFQERFTIGAFGGGVLRLNDGRTLSIMQNHKIPQGTIVMLIKGWTGSNPNPWGMRLAAMQYDEYYRRLTATSPFANMRYQLAMNGAWLREFPLDGCGDLSYRWNTRLFSNAAWMQRKWTGVPACPEVVRPEWPTLQTLPQYARCTPDPRLVLPT